jgi:Uma2 family endonuclease
MSTILDDRVYTPADLAAMPDGQRFELVDGKLVEKEMSALACWIASLLNAALTSYVAGRKLGAVFTSEVQYQCFSDDPQRIRRPDISYIQSARLTPELWEGFVRIAPDLAVEIVSKHDTYYEVEAKVVEYLSAGVRLVWVLNPDKKKARVYRSDGSVSDVASDGQLSGEDVVPGFVTPLESLFQLPA